MISCNMLEAARIVKCERFFYSSSACVYPEHIQVPTSTLIHAVSTPFQR